jgi:cobalamin biosynthesis protein CobT
LVTATYTRWENEKSSGKINRRSLPKLIQGTSNKVFKQKELELHYDTVVMLAVDHSGSMQGSRIETATKTAILLGDVLSQIGVPFSVVGFSANDIYSPGNSKICSRNGSLWIGIYKDFDSPWQTKKFAIGHMPNNIQANTYDGESVRYCARELLSRKEKRKILIWINDGEPCATQSDKQGDHVAFAKMVGKEVLKYIEMIAIGIETNSIKEFYPNAVNINNIDELSGEVLNSVVKFLTPKHRM